MPDDQPVEDKGSFYEQVSAKPEGHVQQADLSVEGDPFAGAGKQAEANLAAETKAAEGKESGQEPGSPSGKEGADTGAEDKGQEATATPTVDKGEEASEADTSTAKPDEGPEKLPYDQDPKWKSARAAEKMLNDLAEKHGIPMEEIGDMLDAGIELKDIVGNQDAQKLVEKAQKMDRTEEYWAEQEALQREQDESAEQTTDRVKKENVALKAEMKQKEADQKARLKNQQVVRDYENSVNTEVDASDLSPEAKVIARNLLGVDNPIDSIDIDDRGKVKTAVGQGIENVGKFIAQIEQNAIDKYAAGKSEITPIPKTQTSVKTAAVEKKPGNPNASLEESFAEAGEQVKAALRKMAAED